MKISLLAALTAMTVALVVRGGYAQPEEELKALRKEVDAVRESQKAMQKDLQEIKKLLQARPQPQVAVEAHPVLQFPPPQGGAPAAPGAGVAAGTPLEAVVSLDGAPFRGDKNAKVTMVEFTDYQ